jgi:site-specific recombinase XerD
MPKVTTETAQKMLQLIKVTTYQGKLTYLMIGFLYQTRTGFSEIVSLTVGDVYRNGRAKKTMIVGEGPRQRTQILDDQARKIIDDLVVLQVQRGHRPSSDAPIFRKPHSGKAFTAEQMASIFWLYQEAAEFEPT